jgi:RNA polymerase sigma-70 factor, ECF subfamily
VSSSVARYFPGILFKRKGEPAQRSALADSLAMDGGAAEAEEEVSDESLIVRLRAKDLDALGLLYRRYARLIYAVCFRILRDSTEAEDLVHEVFLSLLRKCNSFDPAKGTARSWIVQLAYSKCFDWRNYLKARHGKRQGTGLADALPVDVSQPAHDPDPAYFVFWNASMVAAFKSLSKEQRLTLELFYFRGYTLQEVAEKLGYSYGNVKHHVYRGVERLRQFVYNGEGRKAPRAAEQRTQCKSEEMVG